MELQKLGETDEEKLFVETGKALLAEGVILRRVGEARAVSIFILKIVVGISCLFVTRLHVIFFRGWEALFVRGLGFLSPALARAP